VFVTCQVEDGQLDKYVLSKFKKENSIMIWSGILDKTGMKVLVHWEKNNWGMTTTKNYINNILPIALWLFGFWVSCGFKSAMHGRSLWGIKDSTLVHCAGAIKVWQDEYYKPKIVWLQ